MSDYGSLDSREGSPGSFTTVTDYGKPEGPPQDTHEFAAEQSKAVLHHRPDLISYSIHFTSLLFTAIVLQLSFRNVYWADEDGWKKNGWSMGMSQPVMAGLLQFCAKLHEVFILASLSAITIDIIRRRLLVSRGVPFGFLIGGYRFGSTSSIFSGSFWGPFNDAIRSRNGELLSLGLLLGLGAIYANAVGPASAVLIVPTLNWWPAYDLTAVMTGDGAPYPTDIGPTIWLNASCRGDSDDPPFGCPGLGAPDLQNVDYYAGSQDSANRSLTQRYGKARRNLYISSAVASKPGDSGIYISSTLHSVVLEAIGLSGRFVSTFVDEDKPIYRVGRPRIDATGSTSIRSPIVQAECLTTTLSKVQNGSETLVFPRTLLSKTSNPNQQLAVPEEYLTFDNATAGANFSWVDREAFQSQDRHDNLASIGAIATVPHNGSWELNTAPEVLLAACVLDARWAATDISYDPGTSDTVLTNITEMSKFVGATLDPNLRSIYGIGSDSIYTRPEWANLLNAPVASRLQGDRSPPSFENYLNGLGLRINPLEISSHYKTTTSNITKFLSLTLADGLSRVGTVEESFYAMVWDRAKYEWLMADLSGGGFLTSVNENVQRAGTAVTFKVNRYGWGYGIESKTARFAISIMFIHAVFAVVYIIFAIAHWFIYRWSSRAWKNMEQLFALAMVSSQPPSLRGVSTGVGTWDTWKLKVAIREDQELHDSIELAFGERDGGPVGRKEGKIQWRKRYK